jgi:hypothetical protein
MFTPELSVALSLCAEHQRLTLELDVARKRAAVAHARLAEARNTLNAETSDVEALESITPTRVWSGLRGTLADDRQRERAELSAAEEAVAQWEASAAEALEVCRRLEVALSGLGDVESAREQALAAEEKRLLDAGGGAAAQLVEITSQLASVAADKAEVAHAKLAAKQATSALKEASRVLSDAEGWSDYDTFLGGGVFASLAKLDGMDAAGASLAAASAALRQLSASLAELSLAAVEAVRVDGLTLSVDAWFDNFFTDWVVGGRINDAQQRTQQALQAVSRATSQLAGRERELDALAQTLGHAREEVIIQR